MLILSLRLWTDFSLRWNSGWDCLAEHFPFEGGGANEFNARQFGGRNKFSAGNFPFLATMGIIDFSLLLLRPMRLDVKFNYSRPTIYSVSGLCFSRWLKDFKFCFGGVVSNGECQIQRKEKCE